MTRGVLILLVVLAVGGMAYVMLSDGAPDEIGPPAGETEPRESGTDVPESSGTESDSPVPPRWAEPEPEVPAYPWGEPKWRAAMRETLDLERVTFTVKDEGVAVVLARLSGQISLPIDTSGIPAEWAAGSYSLRFDRIKALDALRAVAALMKSEYYLRPTGIQMLPVGVDPVWEPDEILLAGLARAKRILDAGGAKAAPLDKLLPVEFDKTALETILRRVADRIRFDIAIDPAVTRSQRWTPVTLQNEAMTAALVLRDITAEARLDWAAEERRILVTSFEKARVIREERRQAKANASKSVSVAFVDRTLAEVAAEFGRQVGVPLVVDRALWEPDHPRITLRAGPSPLGRVLRLLAPKADARFLIRGEAIYLIPAEDR